MFNKQQAIFKNITYFSQPTGLEPATKVYIIYLTVILPKFLRIKPLD